MFLVLGNGDAACDGGWLSINGRCYFFESSKVPYQEASNICQALHSGADLAIVDDANIHRLLYEKILEYGKYNWIN